MQLVTVKFYNEDTKQFSGKEYTYKTNLILFQNHVYTIYANDYKYDNSVIVISISNMGKDKNNYKYNSFYKEITRADLDKRFNIKTKSFIEKVYFNEAKGTTTVCWTDGTKTKVTCDKEDVFDKEKGIAFCFMKRMYNNRSFFNEDLKKWTREGINSTKKVKIKPKRTFGNFINSLYI